MRGDGRMRFTGKGAPQVFAVIHYDRKRNHRRVDVYIHQTHKKMYTFYERRRFYRSLKCQEYLDTLGADALIVEVEEYHE